MNHNNSIKFITLLGLALTGIATAISDYAKQKEMEDIIDKKINEKLKEVNDEKA